MPKKIIVVDDSRTARLQVKNALAPQGYDVVEAVDGKEGIEKITAHVDAKLVLCDVNMPNLGGIDMLESIPEATRGRLTVLMLTTEADPRLVARAKEFGARGWIVKPFKAELLLAAVRKLAG